MERMSVLESLVALVIGLGFGLTFASMIYSMLIKPYEDRKKKLH